MSVPLIHSVPKDISVDSDGVRHSTLVPIAVSAAGTVVSVECSCVPKSLADFRFHELSFDIVRLSKTDIFAIQNRLVARKVIPSGGAHLVLSIVLASYDRLIQVVKPEYIYRCSAFTGLQQPPLRKHRYISETVQLCGYSLTESGRDRAGRSFWLHRRTATKPAPSPASDHNKSETDAIGAWKLSLSGYFSDCVHGEMRLLGGAAAARHQKRVKIALQTYALDSVHRERHRSAA